MLIVKAYIAATFNKKVGKKETKAKPTSEWWQKEKEKGFKRQKRNSVSARQKDKDRGYKDRRETTIWITIREEEKRNKTLEVGAV